MRSLTTWVSQLRYMSSRARYAVAAGGAGGAGVLGFIAFGGKGLVIVLAGLVVVGLLLLLYVGLLRLARKRKAKRFDTEMRGQSGAAPQSISRAEQLAKLDDLRKRFEDGMVKFRTSGKDVYSLPWFLVVGEPGSGKTEAIRHSNIGFPPGLQDELQGVGGTINMNWWFTNHSVLLDVAGRLMFEEVQTAATSEWQEFLRLLRVQRPNCPVNGLILVIPADSLITDTNDVIQQKAAKISQQLDLIQRTLDIRFPVIVAVTKCDLVNGFREFFDATTEPHLQHQMLGWSNPAPIDEVFQPDHLEAQLQGLMRHLHEKRLLLLKDPAPSQDLSDRRIDEVDSLYDFPASVHRMLPSLKHYLQHVFAASEWSAKPLFLRGIYLTSSMREGAALDAELAEALGVPADTLPEGRVWERERSYFLRDVFVNKLFAEAGLVTRASNVRRQHTRRKMTIMGATACSILLLLGLTWLGYVKLNRSVGGERDLWAMAAQKLGREDGRVVTRIPLVAEDEEDGTRYVYGGSVPVKLGPRTTTIGRFHEDLQKRVEEPIRIPSIFRLSRPFDRSLLNERKSARRVIFELSVLEPLVRAARAKIARLPVEAWNDDATAALAELVRIEAARLGEDYSEDHTPEAPLDLTALAAFVLGPSEDFKRYEILDQDHLRKSFKWAYASSGAAGAWPPPWLPEGGRLEGAPALQHGADTFVLHCTTAPEANSLREQVQLVERLEPLVADFRKDVWKEYTEAEDDYLRVFAFNVEKLKEFSGFLDQDLQDDWRAEYEGLERIMEDVRRQYGVIQGDMERLTVFTGDDLTRSYGAAVTNAVEGVQACFGSLPLPGPARGLLAMAKDKVKETFDLEKDPTLVDDIRSRMTDALTDMRSALLRPDVFEALQRFRNVYAETRKGVDTAMARFEVYEPVGLSDDLKIRKPSWAEVPSYLRDMEVSFVQDDLEEWCKRVDKVFARSQDLGVALPEDSVALVRKNASLGLGRVKSRNFKRECEKLLDNWSQLSGDALRDRDLLLAMTPRTFERKYLLKVPESEDDYVAQYWDELVLTVMASLTDESLLKTETLIPELERYARFPLDVPRPGTVDELSWSELQAAGALLRQIGLADPVEEPKTLGEGAELGAYRIDAQVALLRNLDLGEKSAWILAARNLVRALPDDPGRRYLCKVFLLPAEEQARLIDAHGLGNFKDDSVIPVWTVMQLYEGPGSQARKLKTYAAAPVQEGRLTYPGEGFEFRFFKYHSDVEPSRTVAHSGTWACLRMLHDGQARPMATEPAKWIVPVNLKDEANHERTLWLQLEFEQPLPSLDAWPRYGAR